MIQVGRWMLSKVGLQRRYSMLTNSWLSLVFGFVLSYRIEGVLATTTATADSLQPIHVGPFETDLAAPTSVIRGDQYAEDLYPWFSPGSVPFSSGKTGLRRTNLSRSGGRLDIRAPDECNPGYVLTCPASESKPCCPSYAPVCCPTNDVCCETGYVCYGTPTNPACCLSGSVDCRNGDCCPSGTTCCSSGCCRSGYSCVAGECVNPLLSSMSVQSLASVQSVASISSISRLSVAAASSLQASLSRALVTQSGFSNSNTVTTAQVKPNDGRIKYEPLDAWFDGTSGTGSSNSSPIGACTNGTKVTQTAGAKFTFLFQGTSIALDVVPSSAGGKFTVAIDGGPATDYDSFLSGNSTNNPCIPVRLVTITGLTEAPHQIVVTNGISSSGSSGGKLEISGIVYTGKGAFGSPEERSGPSQSAIIGGSVGGAIGAIVILGGGIVYFMYRKRRNGGVNNASNDGAGAGAGVGVGGVGAAGGIAANNQMVQQPATNAVSPYAIPSGLPSPTGSGHQTLPSQDQRQPFGYPQQPQYSYHPGQYGYQYGYGQQQLQGSATNVAAPVGPLPSWVQRASQVSYSAPVSPPTRPADAASMTSATHSQVHMPYGGMAASNSNHNDPMQQPNAFYGAHYAPNAQSYNPGRF